MATDYGNGDQVEHVVTAETSERSERRGLRVDLFTQTRYVCSCGTVSKWHRHAYLAKSAIDRHALDGQQSLP